jgi:hypothetical protein
MNYSIINKWRSVFILLAAATITSCVTSLAESAVGKDEKKGYFADPVDFYGVNFKVGRPSSYSSLSAALSGPRDQEALENDLSVLQKMPSNTPLRVVGFTDSKECSGTLCVELSQRRAQAVHDWLLRRGVSKSRLSPPYGFGSARPIGDNETEDGRARNRRAYISYEEGAGVREQ